MNFSACRVSASVSASHPAVNHWVFACLLAIVNVNAEAAPTAQLSASRLQGPAPLAVFFDATGTTDSASGTDTFRQLAYRFEFADPGSGTWPHSGRPKNEQIGGPLAAHVFETPGTYVVRVIARDAAGASSEASVTITVQSPEQVFSGANTICISRTQDFAGCPAGASQIGNATSWPAFQSNRRYLLRRGQDFTSIGSISLGNDSSAISNIQLAAFGSGAQPSVASITVNSGSDPATNWHRGVVIADLSVNGITQERGGFDLLLFRNSVGRGSITFASAFQYWLGQSSVSWRNPDGIFIVENRVSPNGGPSITGNGTRIALLGNDVDQTLQHNVRFWQGHKVVVGHNRLTGRSGDSSRHAFKMHSEGLDPVQNTLPPRTASRQRSSQIVIADNQIGSSGSNINWLGVTSPQNGESAEGIEDVIWEDNSFSYGTNFFREITWAGRRMTARGNRNLVTGGTVTAGVGHTDALPTEWRGPYYPNEPSMKGRFSSGPRPASPILRVE